MVIEARLRFVSGTTSHVARAPVVVAFTVSPTVGNALLIGADEIFLLAADLVRGASAAVDTNDAFHTYRIEVNTSTGAIDVFYDGSFLLSGTTFSDVATHGSVARVSFGEGSIFATGTTEWEFVRHNASSVTCVPSFSLATLWIGLKSSDDQGTQFDLRTEVYINDTLVAEGETRCITGVTRNPSKAKEVNVAFGSVSDEGLTSEDVLFLTVLTRIGTNPDNTKCAGPGGSHANAVGLRLYYDATSRPSRFGAEISPEPLTDFFLHSMGIDFFLDATSPTTTSAKFKDSTEVNFAGGNPWKEIGTWSMTLP
jgi:hypothetical protein